MRYETQEDIEIYHQPDSYFLTDSQRGNNEDSYPKVNATP